MFQTSIVRLNLSWLLLTSASFASAGLIVGTGTGGAGTLGGTGANSVVINRDGVGHALVVPYFTAQSGNTSILSIVNTDSLNGKAVKVRYRTAANADTVFDLSVFLGPNDVWNGAVSHDAIAGTAQFSTADSSCTLPALANGQLYPFSTARLNRALSANDLAAQTREGYIEIINMADVPPATEAASLFRSISPSLGVQRSCGSAALLATLTDKTDEASASSIGLSTPSGGLTASWTIVNVPKTLTYSGRATALMAIDQATGLSARGVYMLFPQSAASAGNVDRASADPLLRTRPYASKSINGVVSTYVSASIPLVKPAFSDLPDLSTPLAIGFDDPMAYTAMISKLFAVKSVRNDYATESSIEAATDWIFTFPTKRFSVATDYAQNKPVFNLMTGYDGIEFFSSGNLSFKENKACTDQIFVFYDREEAANTAGDNVFASSGFVKLCGAVAVVPFANPASSALGATVTAEPTGNRAFVNGWGRIDTSNGYTGTPLLGAAFIRATNPAAAQGFSGNYGILSNHRYQR